MLPILVQCPMISSQLLYCYATLSLVSCMSMKSCINVCPLILQNIPSDVNFKSVKSVVTSKSGRVLRSPFVYYSFALSFLMINHPFDTYVVGLNFFSWRSLKDSTFAAQQTNILITSSGPRVSFFFLLRLLRVRWLCHSFSWEMSQIHDIDQWHRTNLNFRPAIFISSITFDK